jgi:hypothetical protein
MCFLLKLGDEFLSEQEIALRIPELQLNRKIDLHTTEGAVSIVYNGHELLGVELWDEINFAIGGLFSQLNDFRQGKTIQEFFPLQSLWVRLIPRGDYLVYELKSTTPRRPLHIRESIPAWLFMREFSLLNIRMLRILAALGNTPSAATVTKWKDSGTTKFALDYLEFETIRNAFEQPLPTLLLESTC